MVAIAGWVNRQQQQVIDFVKENLSHKRFLIHDRDPVFTWEFRKMLNLSGVQTVKLPPRTPTLNAYCERFIRSIKEECLNQIIPIGEKHLRHAVHEYVAHYHGERNHQGMNNQLLTDPDTSLDNHGDITCRERLGGMLKFYHRPRKAA